MNSSRAAYKRARPALGTILLMRLEVPVEIREEALDEILARAFDFCEELEGKFSKFREASDVSRLNQASLERDIPVSREFPELMGIAKEVWRLSDKSFAPWTGDDFPFLLSEERGNHYARKTRESSLDLSGIAKGYVVDQVAEMLEREVPGISGVLNAGGDLRFLGDYPRQAEVRLAQGTEARALQIESAALASSAMSEYLHNETSTTVYTRTPREGLDSSEHVVSVAAPNCAVADALTKVGWFGQAAHAEAAARHYGAQILVFDKHGAICQSFG